MISRKFGIAPYSLKLVEFPLLRQIRNSCKIGDSPVQRCHSKISYTVGLFYIPNAIDLLEHMHGQPVGMRNQSTFSIIAIELCLHAPHGDDGVKNRSIGLASIVEPKLIPSEQAGVNHMATPSVVDAHKIQMPLLVGSKRLVID